MQILAYTALSLLTTFSVLSFVNYVRLGRKPVLQIAGPSTSAQALTAQPKKSKPMYRIEAVWNEEQGLYRYRGLRRHRIFIFDEWEIVYFTSSSGHTCWSLNEEEIATAIAAHKRKEEEDLARKRLAKTKPTLVKDHY